MWPRRAHTLALLTKLTYNKWRFKCTQVEQDAFDEIKGIVTRNTLPTYPYFNKTFKIHTDASAFQLGAVISQKCKTIVSHSRKLTNTQQQYTLTEKKLLRIIETLKGFRNILIGQKLRVYTDNKKPTCNF